MFIKVWVLLSVFSYGSGMTSEKLYYKTGEECARAQEVVKKNVHTRTSMCITSYEIR